MKKFILTFVAMFMAVMAMAQSPSVTITYDSIATDQINTSYAKNESCTNYYIFSGAIGEAEQWAPMMGGVENVIKAWGINCISDTTKVWNQLTPNTERVFYVLAMAGETQVLISDTVSTLALGGEGLSTITIAISEITDSSVHVVATPNDQTAEFHTLLITKSTYNEWGQDSVVSYMKKDPYPQYSVDDHVWYNLIPGTDYKVLAIGMNANDEWGEVAIDSFATTGVAPMPSFTIAFDSIGTDAMKVSYTKGELCDNYYIFSGMEGEAEQWIPMMGSLENVIKSLGIACTNDTTKLWNNLTPNTKYVYYVIAAGTTGEVLITDTVSTLALGGEGLSTIEVTVSEITDSTARVICTPNDQTAAFHTIVLTAELFEEWGQDSVINYVKQDPYPQYAVDDHVWFDLLENTAYKAVALGINANDEWGELSVVDFTTTGSTEGIEDVVENKVSVYPNPTSDFVKVLNVNEGSIVTLFDLGGRVMMQTKANGNEVTLNMNNLTAGMYILQVNNGKGVRIIKK